MSTKILNGKAAAAAIEARLAARVQALKAAGVTPTLTSPDAIRW